MISFKPMLTPKQMLHKGIFGGAYFSELIDYKEFPGNWFKDLPLRYYISDSYCKEVNYFGVKAGQSQKEWEESGWINKDDPRGWFEWYCKYFLGRRHEDDERQIKRWQAFCGPRGRWRNIIYKKIYVEGCSIKASSGVSVRIQQSLLHWSYIINEKDYREWLKKNSSR